MDLNDSAIKLRQVSHDILSVAESMSSDGHINHADVIRVTSVVVESLLRALVNSGNSPDGTMGVYRDTFVFFLDELIQRMNSKTEFDNESIADNVSPLFTASRRS